MAQIENRPRDSATIEAARSVLWQTIMKAPRQPLLLLGLGIAMGIAACGGLTTADDLGSLSSEGSRGPGDDADEQRTASGEGTLPASDPSESPRGLPSSTSREGSLPTPLIEAGFEVDGVSCAVTNEHVTPLAAPGNQWTAEIDATCGGGIGRVSLWMKALREVPYPIACGGWNQINLMFWDTSGVDAGASFTTTNSGDLCSITSGPLPNAPETGIALTALVKGSSNGAVHTLAYRAANAI
ncbi:MAG: hypothetical protein BGO98_28205 [Myxococcales bacterium 68-20]|nr:MAG: hypothetical protein BGO98_28205 [Myxococcales bacterium 68-20]